MMGFSSTVDIFEVHGAARGANSGSPHRVFRPVVSDLPVSAEHDQSRNRQVTYRACLSLRVSPHC